MNKVITEHNGAKVIIAIDPGAAGGMAICAEQNLSAAPLHEQESFLSLDGLCANFGQKVMVCYMEQVGGYIGDPTKSPGSAMFNFGNGYGYWRGVCKALGIPLILVTPQKWMRAVAPGVIGMEYAERKRALHALASHWFPELEVTKASADALGLLRYALGGPASAVPAQSLGRSKDQWRLDVRAFKKWLKTQRGVAGMPLDMPKGQDMVNAVNWWTAQGRPTGK